MNEGEGMV